MRFTCDRTVLVDKLIILARGVSTRSALPVLSGILLQARDGRLELFSTDMELSIKATLTTAIESRGRGGRAGAPVHRRRQEPPGRRGRDRVGEGIGEGHGGQEPSSTQLVGRERLPADVELRH